jgi:hypothetical protein
MWKKIATAALLGTIVLTGAACSSNSGSKDTAASSPAAPSSASASTAASENPEMAQSQAYIAARLAEEKVESLFHQETSADGKPILNPIAPDKAAAGKFLNAYLDPALSEKVLAFYLTEQKADNAIVVKGDKFFSSSIRETASKADVTFEGSGGVYQLTTKTGGVYTVKKNADGKFTLADFSKK